MDKSIYSWQTSEFNVPQTPAFLSEGTYIWVFNWHEIPHLGLSVQGKYFSISIKRSRLNEEVEKIWRLTEIKSVPLFLVKIDHNSHQDNTIEQAFSKPIQEGETCLNPLKLLLTNQHENIQTLSDLLYHLEESNQIISYHANQVLNQKQLTLCNYNKADVLEMISNKMHVYETRK
jgi:hypothetical protein